MAFPAILISGLPRRSLGHDATAAAFTAAQAFHVGGYRRARIETETGESVLRQSAVMRTMQATHDHYATSLTQRGHRPNIGVTRVESSRRRIGASVHWFARFE